MTSTLTEEPLADVLPPDVDATTEPTPPAPEPEPEPEPVSTSLAVYDPDAKSITILTPIAGLILEFHEGQLALNAKQMHALSPLGIGADWDPGEVWMFLLECRSRGLNPWAGQAYLMRYGTGRNMKYVRHTGINGFRSLAFRTGEYDGIVGPLFTADGVTWSEVWLDKHNPPAAAKTGISKKGFNTMIWGATPYDEYAPMLDEWDGPQNGRYKTGEKVPAALWKCAAQGGKPSTMLGKCSEAAAFRRAFDTCGGWYAVEEFDRVRVADADEPLVAAARRAAYAKAHNIPTGSVVEGSVVAVVATPEVTATPEIVSPPGDVWAPWGGEPGAAQLLRLEIVEQTAIMGEITGLVARRADAWRTPYERWTADQLLEAVSLGRRYVMTALRDHGRVAEADTYAKFIPAPTDGTPKLGTCQELFGRDPATVAGDV